MIHMGFVSGFSTYSVGQRRSRYISKTSPETCFFFCISCREIMLQRVANMFNMCPIATFHKICNLKICHKTCFKPYCVHGRDYTRWRSRHVGCSIRTKDCFAITKKSTHRHYWCLDQEENHILVANEAISGGNLK